MWPPDSRSAAGRQVGGVLGEKIARERALRGLSLDELAQRASVSSGLLSQLERGIGNPSLSTVLAIADAFDLPVGTFFEGPPSGDRLVVRRENRLRLALSENDLIYELLVPDLRGSLAMMHIELPPGFSNERRPWQHQGEECVFVLDGDLETHIGDRDFELRAGDSTRFTSSTPHWYRTGNKRVLVISAMTPPSF